MNTPLNLPATLDAWTGRTVTVITIAGEVHPDVRLDILHAGPHDRNVAGLYLRGDDGNAIVPWHAVASIDATNAPAQRTAAVHAHEDLTRMYDLDLARGIDPNR